MITEIVDTFEALEPVVAPDGSVVMKFVDTQAGKMWVFPMDKNAISQFADILKRKASGLVTATKMPEGGPNGAGS